MRGGWVSGRLHARRILGLGYPEVPPAAIRRCWRRTGLADRGDKCLGCREQTQTGPTGQTRARRGERAPRVREHRLRYRALPASARPTVPPLPSAKAGTEYPGRWHAREMCMWISSRSLNLHSPSPLAVLSPSPRRRRRLASPRLASPSPSPWPRRAWLLSLSACSPPSRRLGFSTPASPAHCVGDAYRRRTAATCAARAWAPTMVFKEFLDSDRVNFLIWRCVPLRPWPGFLSVGC